jgi:hypothetical protein
MNITQRPRHLPGYHRRALASWLSRHKKLVKGLLLWLGIPVALIVAAGFVPLSFDGLRGTAERALVKAGASSCTIRKLSLQPWLGFSIDEMELEKKEGPLKVKATIPRVLLAYRIFPLLFKFVVVKDVVIERPRVTVTLPSVVPPGRTQVQPLSVDAIRKALPESPFSILVQNISLRGAEISVVQKGETLVHGDGIDVRMSVGFKRELALTGGARARTLTVDGMWDFTDVRASVSVSELTVALDKGRGDFYGGTIGASGKADLGENTLEGLTLELSHVNLAKLYAACRIRRGQCEGRVDGNLNLGRSDLALDSLSGSGALRLADVSVHDMPLQSGIITSVAVPQLRNITFSKLGTTLEVRGGKVFTPDIKGDGYPLEVRADGWVGLDGYFSEKMKGIFAADLVEKFHPVISRSLDEELDGKKSFTCTVHGTLGNPGIDIDRRITDRAVHNVIDEVRKFFGK